MFGLTPYNRDERNLFRYVEELEKSFFGGLDSAIAGFRADIVDKGDKLVLQAELPGFSKDEIKLDLHDGMLKISAEHSENNEEKNDNYVRRERRYGAFSRSFNVSNIQEDKIKASYQNGVLTLELPKAEPEVEKARRIEIQ